MYTVRNLRDSVVQEWCTKFKDGRTDIHDEGSQEQNSVAAENFIQQVDKVVWERQNFTITDLFEAFSEISRSSIYMIITEELR